jgi:multidrug resistance efflux pump
VEVARRERSHVLLGKDSFEIAAAEQKVRMMVERLRYLRKEHERHQQLVLGSAVSHADLAAGLNRVDEAEAGLKGAEAEYQHLRNYVRGEDRDLAEAKVRLAQARLELAKQRLHETTLRAPFDGKVLEILKREGEAARSTDGEAVLVFADLRGLRVRAEIDERHARGIKVGQEALVFGRGLGKAAFPGRVLAVREIMGRKTVFARTAAERKDLDVLGVLIAVAEDFTAPAGLRVDVQIRAGE